MKRNDWRIATWAIAALMALTMVACSGQRKVIQSNGVHALKLGDPMPPQGAPRLKGHAIRDTFVEQGEYQWREVVMEYRKGRVYLEEDFFGGEKLNRVRVCTPELRTRNGLRVGMSITELHSRASDWTITPLPEYDRLDAYSRTLPRMHFIIDDPSVPKDKNWDEYKLDDIAPTAVIEMIVVF